MFTTQTTTEVNFCGRVFSGETSSYPAGTHVEVLGPLVHDGVALCRFPGGQETYMAAWRLVRPPARAEA